MNNRFGSEYEHCTPYATELQKRKQAVDLVDVNSSIGDAVRHVETDYKVATKTSIEARKSTSIPPQKDSSVERTKLTGHTARRRGDGTVHVVWDTLYPGFGLRFRESGHKTWIVSYRQRKIRRTVTLGSVPAMAIREARREARRILSQVQLEGLPTKANEQVKCALMTATIIILPDETSNARSILVKH